MDMATAVWNGHLELLNGPNLMDVDGIARLMIRLLKMTTWKC